LSTAARGGVSKRSSGANVNGRVVVGRVVNEEVGEQGYTASVLVRREC
jgi:hypothetical protein